jgi:hypothetical protein
MQLYFVTRRDAIKYLMAIRSEAGTNRHSAVLVNTHLHEFGADAVERVLLDVRAGRVSYFVQSGSAVGDRIVFIS